MRREVAQLNTQGGTPMGPRSGGAPMEGMGTMPMHVSATSPPVSVRDRVYTADQTSNTVSVIDPSTNALLGVIRLGDPVPAALSPLYKGELLVHGLGYSPDHRTLAVVSIGSNSVTFMDTATNQIRGTVYVGRSPHEAFFTPNGREVWVAVRGEDYVSVIDPVNLREIRRIPTANGPGMVLFRPDGEYAFVPSSFTPQMDVIDTHRYAVVARIPQASPFSPNLAVSPDGTEVWFTLKDVGKTQVMNTEPPFRILATLETGPITNHVALVDTPSGHFAYVSVGGLNQVKVYRCGPHPDLVATIPTGDLPHGIWPSGDGSRVYVGLENGDAVQVIDTKTNTVTATIPTGALPQALVYVPDAVPSGPGTANLISLAGARQALHVELVPADGTAPAARASVVVNPLGLVDQLQIAASGLEPGREYQLDLVEPPRPPFHQGEPLARIKASPGGSAITQAIGPLRSIVTSAGQAASASTPARYLVMSTVDTHQPVLVQRQP